MTEPAPAGRLAIATLAKRPDLLPIVAGWLWRERWQRDFTGAGPAAT